jgi:hypothetical protein
VANNPEEFQYGERKGIRSFKVALEQITRHQKCLPRCMHDGFLEKHGVRARSFKYNDRKLKIRYGCVGSY